MFRVEMTDEMFERFLLGCNAKDATMFVYEYIWNKENAQNEEANKGIGLNRDDFQRLVDRICKLEGTVLSHRERIYGLEKRVDNADEKVNNIYEQQKCLVNSINAYTSKPIDVFKLQEQGNKINRPGYC